jgi:hypothetical protein
MDVGNRFVVVGAQGNFETTTHFKDTPYLEQGELVGLLAGVPMVTRGGAIAPWPTPFLVYPS